MMKHLPKLTAYWRKYNAGIVWALTDEEVEKLYNEVGRTSIYRVFFVLHWYPQYGKPWLGESTLT